MPDRVRAFFLKSFEKPPQWPIRLPSKPSRSEFGRANPLPSPWCQARLKSDRLIKEQASPRSYLASRIVPLLALVFLASGCAPSPPSIIERQALKGHSREVVSLAFSPDGKTVASRGGDAVKVWDVARGVEVASFPQDGSDFGSVAFSPDGKTLAATRPEIGAVAYEPGSNREPIYYRYPPGQPEWSRDSVTYGWGLAYSPDGKTLAGGGSRGGEDGYVTLWGTSSAEGVALKPLGGPITSVAYSPDGRTIATGVLGGKLVLWDVAGRRERLQIEARRSYLAPVSFSPDGRIVASANESRWVKLWEVATGKEVGALKGHLKAVLSLAFHPDGKTLASGDSVGTLFVWDVTSMKMTSRVESKDRGKVWGLAFSPDGKTLVSAGEDRLIHLWDVSEPDPSR